MDDDRYLVLGSRSSGTVQAFGTSEGRLFRSERAAQTMANRLEKVHPRADFLLLPLARGISAQGANESAARHAREEARDA